MCEVIGTQETLLSFGLSLSKSPKDRSNKHSFYKANFVVSVFFILF